MDLRNIDLQLEFISMIKSLDPRMTKTAAKEIKYRFELRMAFRDPGLPTADKVEGGLFIVFAVSLCGQFAVSLR